VAARTAAADALDAAVAVPAPAGRREVKEFLLLLESRAGREARGRGGDCWFSFHGRESPNSLFRSRRGRSFSRGYVK
jgi:hypothetical protein